MEDNENVFTITPKNQSSNNKKSFSFQNPFTRRTIDPTNTGISLQISTENDTESNTPIQLSKDPRGCSLLTNRPMKYFLIILLILILTTGIIILAILYIQCKEQHLTAG